MEVVLSPGRFGEEAPGAPFQNEEIREWSHVDRLTGMLERARVETGRWKTLNQGAARSYGKVIDSRERNSADGSVVQRARRQVEVFQSEGAGRSVQVVRASQWSSSRVTDSTTASLLPMRKLSPPAPLSLCRDESMSERLSTLLGSFAHHTASSTVPFRRIDSKYATRTPISLQVSKRSTSNEDLSGGPVTAMRSSRDLNKNEHLPKIDISKIRDPLTSSDEDTRHQLHETSVAPETRIYTEILRDDENRGARDNCQNAIAIDELRPTTSKAAIQLPPSSKANTTVVNLIKDSDDSQTETADNRPKILSWVLSPTNHEEAAQVDVNDATTETTATMLSTSTATTTTSPRRDSRLEEPTVLPFSPGRSGKRVGFCKTEIHFAADSGKVNIVETDGKPPPTNKFRRRRRNSLTGVSNAKNLPSVEAKKSPEDGSARADPYLHRGHTTTVNLGSHLAGENERTNGGFPEGQREPLSAERQRDGLNFPGTLETSSQGILLRFENRIYDRLESYTSELFLDPVVSNLPKASPGINIHRNDLKSARLVMNLTRVIDSDVSGLCAAKLRYPDNQEEPSDQPLRTEDSELCPDWRAWRPDNESPIKPTDDQWPKLCSSTPTAIQCQNLHEISDTPRIESAPSEATVESTEHVRSCSPDSPLTAVELEHEAPKSGCNVVCTDSENNQVLLKVVTTHEPTIARVESDHLRPKIKPSVSVPGSGKKEKRASKCPALSGRKSESHKEHTYVNVFTGSKRTPIYENYKPIETPPTDNKIGSPSTTDANCATEKNVRAADNKSQSSQSSSSSVLKSSQLDCTNFEAVKVTTAAVAANVPTADGKLAANGTELRCRVDERSQVASKKTRSKTKETNDGREKKLARVEGSSCNVTSHPATLSRGRSGKQTPRSSVSSNERTARLASGNAVASGNNPSTSKPRDAASAKTLNKADALTKQKPIQVVYQTAVYNMKNEKLKKPQKGNEPKGPRYFNQLICGAKFKRPSESKNGKTSGVVQHAANNKTALQPIKHWK